MSDSSIEGAGAELVEPNTSNPIFATAMPLGTPVTPDNTEDNAVVVANASGVGTAQIIGLVMRKATAGHRGGVRYLGPLTLPAGDWAAVLDTGTALTQGVPYYVSTTPGKITKTAPVTSGKYLAPIGYALSTQTMMIQPTQATRIP